jgi:hypothetical protein
MRSPYWEVPKPQVVRDMDSVCDPERYSSLEMYVDVLHATARKNPEEFEFYIQALQVRQILLRQIQTEVEEDAKQTIDVE